MFKKFFFIFIIINLSFNLDAQDLRLYPFKSGMIKYKFEGRISGTEIIYFDEYGKLISDLKIINHISNTGSKYDSIQIILKHDTIFELDVSNHTAVVISSTKKANKTYQNIISQETIKILGYTKMGCDNISGINCDKFSGENGSLWVWNNIVLKSEIKFLGSNIVTEVTEIIIDIDIKKNRFEISSNYTIVN